MNETTIICRNCQFFEFDRLGYDEGFCVLDNDKPHVGSTECSLLAGEREFHTIPNPVCEYW